MGGPGAFSYGLDSTLFQLSWALGFFGLPYGFILCPILIFISLFLYCTSFCTYNAILMHSIFQHFFRPSTLYCCHGSQPKGHDFCKVIYIPRYCHLYYAMYEKRSTCIDLYTHWELQKLGKINSQDVQCMVWLSVVTIIAHLITTVMQCTEVYDEQPANNGDDEHRPKT